MDKKSAEDQSVAAMLKAVLKGSPPVDVFSSWILAVTGTVASLMITQADKTQQILSPCGLFWCEWFLFLCCCFGVVAKFFALVCAIENDVSEATTSEITPIMQQYFSSLPTDPATSPKDRASQFLPGMLEKFVLAQPWFMRSIVGMIVRRQSRKDFSVPYLLYVPRILHFHLQGVFTGLQILAFFCFLVVGFLSRTG